MMKMTTTVLHYHLWLQKYPLQLLQCIQKANPIINTVAVEMGSIDACLSPSKCPWTDLLAHSTVMEDQPHAATGGDFIDL